MRLLVLGKNGQLATALRRVAGKYDSIHLTFAGRPEMDVTDARALRRAISDNRPDAVINATAYTAVDKAEDEPERAFAVNRDAVAVMGEAAAAIGCPVIHVSTDYVFDGTASRPYRFDDATNPRSVYGKSKLAGEAALAAAQPEHVIIRTGWLYSADGANFMNTMLRLAEGRESLSVVDDQTGSPTVADDLAEAILKVCQRIGGGHKAWGVFHYGGAGSTTWFGFARSIFEEAKARGLPFAEVSPTTTEAFGAKAPRPAYSILDCARLAQEYGVEQKEWRARLSQVLDQRERLLEQAK